MDQFLYKTIDIATAIDVNTKKPPLSSSSNAKTGFNNVINYSTNDNVNPVDSGPFVKSASGVTASTGHRKNAAFSSFNRADEFNNSHIDVQDNSVILTGLKPLTEYTILVQAYNSMGAGPQSDQVNVRTLEEGKPSLCPFSP